MDERTKETIILVHGTWAAPVEGKHQWYQEPSATPADKTFVEKLNTALAHLGSEARCWAHCVPPTTPFAWSGANSWVDRANAADALAAYINRLQDSGWRCHIVAHSHGGNIVAEAVPRIMRNTAGCNPGTIVTLGTPFLDTNTARIAAKRKIDRHTSGIYWLMYAILYTMLSACLIIAILLAFYAAWQGWSIFRAFEGLRSILDNESQIPAWKSFFRYALNTTPQWLLVVSCLALVLLALLTVSGLLSKRRKRTSDGWDNFWTHAGKDKPFWLVLASLKDEAWQLLHHIRTISNPLSPNVSMLAQMRADRQEYIEGSWSQLRLRGIRPLSDYGRLLRFCIWLSLLLAAVAVICAAFAIMLRGEEPWLDLYRGEGSVSLATTIARVAKYALYAYAVVFAFSIIAGGRGYAAAMHSLNYSIKVLFNSFSVIPNGIIPYLVRQRGWHIIQQIALGLKGFEWDLPEVRQVPEFARDCAVLSLLTERTERRALARRNEWAASYLGDISQVLSKMVLSAADISFLVRLVEEDSSLVHASYYTDEECIDRIARWIAGKS